MPSNKLNRILTNKYHFFPFKRFENINKVSKRRQIKNELQKSSQLVLLNFKCTLETSSCGRASNGTFQLLAIRGRCNPNAPKPRSRQHSFVIPIKYLGDKMELILLQFTQSSKIILKKESDVLLVRFVVNKSSYNFSFSFRRRRATTSYPNVVSFVFSSRCFIGNLTFHLFHIQSIKGDFWETSTDIQR